MAGVQCAGLQGCSRLELDASRVMISLIHPGDLVTLFSLGPNLVSTGQE